jgi:hypothetical protein
MGKVMTFMADNWVAIVAVITVAINVLNASTNIWSSNAGVKKWVMFLISALSVIRSANSFFVWKAPLVPEGENSASSPLPASYSSPSYPLPSPKDPPKP